MVDAELSFEFLVPEAVELSLFLPAITRTSKPN